MTRIRDIISKTQREQLGSTSSIRTFYLDRKTDLSEVSGTGRVAEGAQFSDGTVVMRWLSGTPTTTIFDSIDDLIHIHGHGGATEVCWDGEVSHEERQAS